MSRREYRADLTLHHKLIVGEGESDRNFFAAFCAHNAIEGFAYAFAGMLNENYSPSGFDCFETYLPALSRLAAFSSLADLILACDSTDNPVGRLAQLRTQIRRANLTIGNQVFSENPVANIVATTGTPRIHVLMIPFGAVGGLESVCFDVARDHLNLQGDRGTQIEGWVNTFADSACAGWTTEKRDKLRLQGFMSAAWPRKPELHFSQLFDITRSNLVPLDGPAFGQIRTFLQNVAAL